MTAALAVLCAGTPAYAQQSSVTPTVTESVAFVVPKDARYWGEFNVECYRALGGLSLDAASLAQKLEEVSPHFASTLQAADVDVNHDLQAVGAFECGSEPCVYFALALRSPAKLAVALKALPDTSFKDLGGAHYTLEFTGAKGPRTLHVRTVPIRWDLRKPKDALSSEVGTATHVVFVGARDGKNAPDVDPVPRLADGSTALAEVNHIERLLADKRGRCLLGTTSDLDFTPGFKLQKSRFALAVPPATNDPLMVMLGVPRTIDAEVDLVLSPTPGAVHVTTWIGAATAQLAEMAASVRSEFAATPQVNSFIEVATLIIQRGFRHQLDSKSLRLSWRTDRIPQVDLAQIEQKLGPILGSLGTLPMPKSSVGIAGRFADGVHAADGCRDTASCEALCSSDPKRQPRACAIAGRALLKPASPHSAVEQVEQASAMFYLQAGCVGGVGEACRALADAYTTGLVKTPDAAALYKKACELGDRGGCLSAHDGE